jgi:glycosyltransferase involved in cell wall biosynthesis
MHSGIVDHAESLLPVLKYHLDVTAITDGSYHPSHPMFQKGSDGYVPWMGYPEFEERASEFDLVVYQLGNEPHIHGYMFEALRRYPGLVCLHDLTLHHAIAGLALERGDWEAYVAEMRYSYGARGEELARQVMRGEGERVLNEYPLVERVLDSSLAVVGFNGYMCDRIRELRPELPIRAIPLHLYEQGDSAADFDDVTSRRQHALAGGPLLGTFGLANPNNRLNVVLAAFAMLVRRYPDANYLFVGSPPDKLSIEAGVKAHGLEENVRFTGWVSQDDFIKYMLSVDLAVQLRYPHAGSTCYPPLRLLSRGVPTIISDIAPMAELPSDCVVRIPPEEAGEEALLFAAMDYLLEKRKVAQAMAKRGQAYVREQHKVTAVACELANLMREVAERRKALERRVRERREGAGKAAASHDRLIEVTAAALAEMGVSSSADSYLELVAEAIGDLTSGHSDGSARL